MIFTVALSNNPAVNLIPCCSNNTATFFLEESPWGQIREKMKKGVTENGMMFWGYETAAFSFGVILPACNIVIIFLEIIQR